MITFQLIIFASIYICTKKSEKAGNAITAFWVIFTLVEVFVPWLMVIQFIVIVAARSVAKK